MTSFAHARELGYHNARPLEPRVFATAFAGAPAGGSVAPALVGYGNADGGFGVARTLHAYDAS